MFDAFVFVFGLSGILSVFFCILFEEFCNKDKLEKYLPQAYKLYTLVKDDHSLLGWDRLLGCYFVYVIIAESMWYALVKSFKNTKSAIATLQGLKK